MDIKISSLHSELKDAVKQHAEDRANKLGRFYDRLLSVDVVFNIDHGKSVCEMIAKADHHTNFVAKETHQEAFGAVDAAAKDLERQITRHKEKFRNRKHLTGPSEKE